MRGTVRFTIAHDDTLYTATLEDDWSWTFSPPLPEVMGLMLAARFRRICEQFREQAGPLYGWTWSRELAEAARFVEGTWELAPRDPAPFDPDVVY